MYQSDDKKSAIQDVQRFLLVIGQRIEIPHLSVDGFWSEETEAAVRAFQGLYRLDATGIVDKETFDLIYSEYVRIATASNDKSEFYDASFPLKLGDAGNSAAALNSLLNELSHFYKDLLKLYGDFYSQDTRSNVKMMQKYLRTEENGETSAEFFNALKKELKERQKFVSVNIT